MSNDSVPLVDDKSMATLCDDDDGLDKSKPVTALVASYPLPPAALLAQGSFEFGRGYNLISLEFVFNLLEIELSLCARLTPGFTSDAGLLEDVPSRAWLSLLISVVGFMVTSLDVRCPEVLAAAGRTG